MTSQLAACLDECRTGTLHSRDEEAVPPHRAPSFAAESLLGRPDEQHGCGHQDRCEDEEQVHESAGGQERRYDSFIEDTKDGVVFFGRRGDGVVCERGAG